ncbi:MAG: penicillin-binding protein activator [Hyphomicrobiales bacterium]
MTSNFVSLGSKVDFGAKTLKVLAVIGLGLALSGCVASSRLGGGLITPSQEAAPQNGPAETDATPSVTSEPIAGTELPPPGTSAQTTPASEAAPAPATAAPPLTGTPKIALLLPLSASGGTGGAAQALINAADLAMADLPGASIELVVKDERGTPDGAREATKQAIAEGASVIIGPLLASSVQATGSIARSANRPVIAFSTDIGVAGRGVYLLSFLPQCDVDRILSFAAAKGKKTIAALIPESTYGNAVNATLQDVAARNGITIKAIERYTPGAIDPAAQRLSAIKDQIDALFIPENGDNAASVAKALSSAGLDPKKIQLLGTSAWDDPRIFSTPAFANGWFAMPDKSGYETFAAKYRERFGSDPTRIATLAYDAIFLLNALKKNKGDKAFDAETLATPEGAIGLDGLFRFRQDGTNQRGLVIMQVNKGGATKIDNAPTNFP